MHRVREQISRRQMEQREIKLGRSWGMAFVSSWPTMINFSRIVYFFIIVLIKIDK